MTMNTTRKITAALLLGLVAGAGALQNQTPTATPSRAAPTLSVQLPANSKLDAKLTLSLPTGADLGTVLSAVARAGGLTLLARDVPPLKVTTKLSGVSIRQALETLLSVYADQIGARLIGNTLIVAPPGVIAGLQPRAAPERRVIPGEVSSEVAAQISALSGAQIVTVGKTTILSGTAAQLKDAADLVSKSRAGSVQPAPAKAVPAPVFRSEATLGTLDPAVTERALSALYGVQVITAYGRAYLQSGDEASMKAALNTLAQLRTDAQQQRGAQTAAATQQAAEQTAQQTAQAGVNAPLAPATQRRTLSSDLDADLISRISEALGGVKLTALESGTYLIVGTAADLDSFTAAVGAAETRERLRVIVVYPDRAAQAARLSRLMPTLSVQASGTGLEVRATPQQQVQVSGLLASWPSPAAPIQAEPVTVRIALAYASGSSIITQLSALYGEAAGNGAAGSGSAGGTETGGTGAAAGASSAVPGASSATLAGNVRVVADPRTQSVILTGPEPAVSRVKRTVLDLDSRVQDVRMALKIEQISGSTGQDLGVNWKVGAGGLSIGQTGGTLSAGFTPGVSPLTLEASLNAARSQGRAKTLLDTTFVAQNGLTSNFKNGGQLLLTTQNTASTNGTSTTTSTTTTYNYGLSVLLTPRLAPDGRVELSVQLQIGQPPRSTGPGAVVIESQNLNTTSTLLPGQPLILGSVLTVSDNAEQKGVPVLSQLPVIGPLFGTQTHSASNAVLLITVQAAASSDSRAPSPPVMDTSGSGVTRITIPGR